MTRMTAARGDLATSAAVAFLGLFMWWGTLRIETSAGVFAGPRLFPSIVATGLLILAGTLAASAMLNWAKDGRREAPSAHSRWTGLWEAVIPLTGMMILYVALLNGTGYLVASLLISPAVFFLFGCRGAKLVLGLPVVLTALMYLVFFRLLGMFDPPGRFLDLSNIL